MIGTAHSIWLIGLCLPIGFAYALLLYAKTSQEAFPLWLKRTAFVFRMLSVSLICFLLLRPTFESRLKQVEKPVILIGSDQSQSVVLGKDSAFYKGEYIGNLQSLINHLSKDYQIGFYTIGDSIATSESVTNSFKGKSTPISKFFKLMSENYMHQNVGAIVLLSDGIYTEGSNPLYEAKYLKAPIYTVALGDTAQKKDARIAKINYNKTVFKNNLFPLEILVQAELLGGKKSNLTILKDGKKLFEKQITYQSGHSEWIRLNLEASESGYLHYQILLDGVEEELTLNNNRSDIIVQVLEERKKIAIVYNAPHPDIAALKESVKENTQYQVDCYEAASFRLADHPCDLLILHQLPNSRQPIRQLLDMADKADIPILYFTGNMSDNPRLANLPCGLQIRATKNIQNDAYPSLNQDFSDFNLPSGFDKMLSQMPPLQVPYGTYMPSPNSKICIYQNINNIKTNYPILLFQDNDGKKSGVCLGEGWWRWRIYDYMWNGSHEIFNALVSQIFQYLMVKEDKSFFRVKTQNIFTENENVIFDAELYNKNYEMTNSPEASLTLYEDKKPQKKYNYLFSRNSQAYHLDVGRLPAGDYHWIANVKLGNDTYNRSGRFCVQQMQIEALNLTADHQLLQNIANLNNAKMFYPNQMEQLEKAIRKNDQIKSVVKYTKKHHSLLNNRFCFLLIILLLGGEWFLRKWSGNY